MAIYYTNDGRTCRGYDALPDVIGIEQTTWSLAEEACLAPPTPPTSTPRLLQRPIATAARRMDSQHTQPTNTNTNTHTHQHAKNRRKWSQDVHRGTVV